MTSPGEDLEARLSAVETTLSALQADIGAVKQWLERALGLTDSVAAHEQAIANNRTTVDALRVAMEQAGLIAPSRGPSYVLEAPVGRG